MIAEFRANGGTVGGGLRTTPLLLLGITGARSGRPRTTRWRTAGSEAAST